MKLLDGSVLASYIKQRQLGQVRGLVQANHVIPKLAIIRTNPDPVVDSYMKMKQKYGSDIGVTVDVCTVEQSNALAKIKELNSDDLVHGIIVQIPLPNPLQTDEILNSVVSGKDVDGLAQNSDFDPATPMAISWLLAGYNIDLPGKNIVIVGHGRLVGRPLAKMWQDSDLIVNVVDRKIDNLPEITKEADILVCATGVPGLISSEMVKPNVILVDAGVATDSNGLVGDVKDEVRTLPDITITPAKGGVGPLTICALFDNVIRSAKNTIQK